MEILEGSRVEGRCPVRPCAPWHSIATHTFSVVFHLPGTVKCRDASLRGAGRRRPACIGRNPTPAHGAPAAVASAPTGRPARPEPAVQVRGPVRSSVIRHKLGQNPWPLSRSVRRSAADRRRWAGGPPRHETSRSGRDDLVQHRAYSRGAPPPEESGRRAVARACGQSDVSTDGDSGTIRFLRAMKRAM
jgi:hypothetical protein